MIKKYLKCSNLLILTVILPFIYGCVPGSDTSSLTGFLFGGGGLGGVALLDGGGAALGGGAELATLHQPEPASMLLLGSGLAAMSYFKSKTGRRKK